VSTLVLPDIRINYYDSGNNPDTVVLIHGMGANLAFWYPIISGLTRHDFRVIAYDLRGHGYSSRPTLGYRLSDMDADLVQLTRHLDLQRFHLVGHSFGARIALHFALLHPERLKSLVIADTQLRALQPPMRLRDWPHWQRWKTELSAQGHTEFPNEDEEISFRLLSRFNSGHTDITQPQHALKRPSLHHRRMGNRGAGRWEELMNNSQIVQELDDETHLEPTRITALPIPVLLAFGEYSHCLPSGQRLHELLPGAKYHLIPGAGHFFPARRPKLFLHHLLRHLGATPGL